jgi:sulfur-oxidizing protein SoxX
VFVKNRLRPLLDILLKLMQIYLLLRPASALAPGRSRTLAVRNSMRARRAALIVCTAGLAWAANCVPAFAAEPQLAAYRVDNGAIRVPLTREPGDAERGRAAVLSRDAGNCFLCHTVPDAGEIPLGNIGPPLAGVGKRLNAAQLRLRLVDSTRINPQSVMPAYYRTEGLNRVASAYRGKPLLTMQQIEDVIVYLLTLHD